MNRKVEYRFDAGSIKSYHTEDGFLKAKVILSKAGVFPYQYEDGKLSMEAKLPEDILSSQTINSAKGIPITNEHPDNFVDTYNYSNLVKGNVSEIKTEDNQLTGLATIYDQSLIEAIKSGKKEVSIGFRANVLDESGVFNNQKYDRVQKDISINHLAITEKGRAGSDVRLLVDSKFAIQKKQEKEKNMNETYTYRTTDGRDIQLDSVVHQEIMNLKNQKVSDSNIEGLRDENSALKSRVEHLKAKVDALEDLSKVKDSKEEKQKQLKIVHGMAMERSNILNIANQYLDGLDLSKLDNLGIKTKIVDKFLPVREGVEKTEAVIDARYDAVLDKLDLEGNKSTVSITDSVEIEDSEISDLKEYSRNMYHRDDYESAGGKK